MLFKNLWVNFGIFFWGGGVQRPIFCRDLQNESTHMPFDIFNVRALYGLGLNLIAIKQTAFINIKTATISFRFKTKHNVRSNPVTMR